MTDHKFTVEQIIEALEIRMLHDAVCREAYDCIIRQKKEIENLRNEVEILQQWVESIPYTLEQITEARKIEAIKEFAERLKHTLVINNEENDVYFDYAYTLETIDNLVKEMTEENK